MLELRREPGPRGRGVGGWAREGVGGGGGGGVRRVTHLVEALAGRVLRTAWNQRTGAVRFTRRLDPGVGVDPGGGCGDGPGSQAGTALVTPVSGVDSPVDPRGVHERVDVGRG